MAGAAVAPVSGYCAAMTRGELWRQGDNDGRFKMAEYGDRVEALGRALELAGLSPAALYLDVLLVEHPDQRVEVGHVGENNRAALLDPLGGLLAAVLLVAASPAASALRRLIAAADLLVLLSDVTGLLDGNPSSADGDHPDRSLTVGDVGIALCQVHSYGLSSHSPP
jgi:hypothetical protein